MVSILSQNNYHFSITGAFEMFSCISKNVNFLKQKSLSLWQPIDDLSYAARLRV